MITSATLRQDVVAHNLTAGCLYQQRNVSTRMYYNLRMVHELSEGTVSGIDARRAILPCKI